jgi:hypothetical protein
MTTAGPSFARRRKRSPFLYALHFTIKVRHFHVLGCVQEAARWIIPGKQSGQRQRGIQNV